MTTYNIIKMPIVAYYDSKIFFLLTYLLFYIIILLPYFAYFILRSAFVLQLPHVQQYKYVIFRRFHILLRVSGNHHCLTRTFDFFTTCYADTGYKAAKMGLVNWSVGFNRSCLHTEIHVCHVCGFYSLVPSDRYMYIPV